MKSPLKACEPTADELEHASQAYEVELISFSRELEKLDPSEYLPRYNHIKFTIRSRDQFDSRPLYVTVRRHGSEIGAKNFYSVPLFAEAMPAGTQAEYELLSFDSFNLPFENISIEMCRPEDYLQRRVSAGHIERARKFALKVG